VWLLPLDDGEERFVHPQDALQLVEELDGRILAARRAGERRGQPRDRFDFPEANGGLLLRLAQTNARLHEQVPLAPTREDGDRGRVGRHDKGEDDSRIEAERVPISQGDCPDESRGSADQDEKEPDAEAEPREPAGAPERWRKSQRQSEIEAGEKEERPGFEEDDSSVVIHWAR
jgi:hypothetical protein